MAALNEAMKFAPYGRPMRLTARGLWRRYAANRLLHPES